MLRTQEPASQGPDHARCKLLQGRAYKPEGKRKEKEGRGGEEGGVWSLFLKQKVESVDRLAGSWPVVYMMPGLQY